MSSTPTADDLPGLAHADSMLRKIDHRTQDSFAYAREIQRPWGELDSVLTWCKSYLVGDWRWQLIEMSNRFSSGRYIFYFDSDQDVALFTLKWC
jgi:hypothetical protein